MNKQQIEKEIRHHMENYHGVPEIGIDEDLEMACMDSIDEIEMVMWIEERFNLEISDDIIMGWETLRDVVDYVERAL